MKILHIGYPRAASSLIQDEILSRCDAPHVISNESMGFDWVPESDQEQCWIKAPRLAKEYPGARIIIVVRHPGEWLLSWWKYQGRSLNDLGVKTFSQSLQTKFFSHYIAPHVWSEVVEMTFSRYFDDIKVIPFALLKTNPKDFVSRFCEYAEIPVPEGIKYRKVNFSRSHAFCLIRVILNRIWIKFGVRKWDRQYLKIMKHYIARIDGLWRYYKRKEKP